MTPSQTMSPPPQAYQARVGRAARVHLAGRVARAPQGDRAPLGPVDLPGLLGTATRTPAWGTTLAVSISQTWGERTLRRMFETVRSSIWPVCGVTFSEVDGLMAFIWEPGSRVSTI